MNGPKTDTPYHSLLQRVIPMACNHSAIVFPRCGAIEIIHVGKEWPFHGVILRDRASADQLSRVST